MMRDGYKRARDIEAAAASLVSWSEEFIGDVLDHQGNRIYSDWQDLLGILQEALRPLDEAQKP